MKRLQQASVRAIILGIVLISAVSCGYFSSGTWEDDPGNFKRAWGTSPPPDIEMVHSWYWRSPHFTREESYFFEFKKHDRLLEGFIAANHMRPIERTGDVRQPDFCFDKPAWFAPKNLDAYRLWLKEPPGESWLFSDTATGEIFIYACQM